MNYEQCRSDAIENLKNYNFIKASLSTLPAQIDFLRQNGIYVGTPAGQRVDCTRDSDSAFVAHIHRLEQLEYTLEVHRVKLNCIDTALQSLAEGERELLCAFYINRQRNCVNTLARKNYTDRSCIYRRAQRALEKYILAYYGVGKK